MPLVLVNGEKVNSFLKIPYDCTVFSLSLKENKTTITAYPMVSEQHRCTVLAVIGIKLSEYERQK